MTYMTAIPSQYYSITGEYLRDSECGHSHKSIRTAENCSRKRNPTGLPGTIQVKIIHTDWSEVSSDEYIAEGLI